MEQQITKFSVSYEERISSRTGKPYKCLVIHIGSYDKVVLVSVPERALVEQEISKSK